MASLNHEKLVDLMLILYFRVKCKCMIFKILSLTSILYKNSESPQLRSAHLSQQRHTTTGTRSGRPPAQWWRLSSGPTSPSSMTSTTS